MGQVRRSGRLALFFVMAAGLVVAACKDTPPATMTEPVISWNRIAPATGGIVDPPCSGPNPVSLPVGARRLDTGVPGPGDPPPECQDFAALSCPSWVAWGGQASCAVVTSYPYHVVVNWEFESSDPAWYVTANQATGNSWQGPMIISGKVKAQVMLPGGLFRLVEATISVGPRPAMSWATTVGGDTAIAGEIDACFRTFLSPDSVEAGYTSGQSCSGASESMRQALFTPALPTIDTLPWYTSATIPSGPNKGAVYVAHANVTMKVRTQLNRRYRADGDTLPITGTEAVRLACHDVFGNLANRTHRQVNLQCAAGNPPATQFAAFVAQTWVHERKHMDSALVAARRSAGDLHAMLGPMVAGSEADLKAVAANSFNQAHAHVKATAHFSHTNSTVPFYPVLLFRSSDSKWIEATLRANN